jgi:hypothetical protein
MTDALINQVNAERDQLQWQAWNRQHPPAKPQ